MALATTLSISGGLTVFLAIVVSFGYSILEFATAFQHETISANTLEGQSWLAATIGQGVGILVVYAVDLIVQKLTPGVEPETPKQLNHASEMGESIRGSIDDSVLLESPREQGIVKMDEAAKEKLQRMGILSGIAIALHNIPAGIATFTAGIEDPAIGLSMAIGVGLHNIAEGVAVAAPVYFATGSKWKGIMWCVIAAVAEHVGAFIALAIIGVKHHDDAHFAQASLFGVVSGMMATITMKEIFPTAYTYANGRIYLVSNGALLGMILMALSLYFFKYVGIGE
ncbi:Zinc (Zn2)-Iron (Fe2) Permease (ZIP) Family [Phytophthora palmivora]|uniref:Zinc (Zn2)-Iron (Fe2) Permease (ZIP) Family n=1 Tax=Phytophthora palmivora TaxID=4796 RepID=A0A2P4XFC0_9STRA|nr:Zinc (Zn2)-Iron (Fe2) Permease (ZIP) Family [Phytophthora palmivora]